MKFGQSFEILIGHSECVRNITVLKCGEINLQKIGQHWLENGQGLTVILYSGSLKAWNNPTD